jgi:hypothetical protein
MFPFRKLYEEHTVTSPRVGDRFIYDRRSGTLQIYRPDGDVEFELEDRSRARHCFVGREWTDDLTKASAELYARLGGLHGDVRKIEGSFPTLLTFEVVG